MTELSDAIDPDQRARRRNPVDIRMVSRKNSPAGSAWAADDGRDLCIVIHMTGVAGQPLAIARHGEQQCRRTLTHATAPRKEQRMGYLSFPKQDG